MIAITLTTAALPNSSCVIETTAKGRPILMFKPIVYVLVSQIEYLRIHANFIISLSTCRWNGKFTAN